MGNTIAPVIVGLAVGVAFLVVLAIVIASLSHTETVLTVAEGNWWFYSQPPEEIIVTVEDHDDVDGCCDEVGSITFDHELKVTVSENDR